MASNTQAMELENSITIDQLRAQETSIRNMTTKERQSLWSIKKLSDFEEGTVFIFKSHTIQDTANNSTMLLVEFEKFNDSNEEGAPYTSGTLCIPSRFLDRCIQSLPCIAVYEGSLRSKAGRSYYNLNFINSKE